MWKLSPTVVSEVKKSVRRNVNGELMHFWCRFCRKPYTRLDSFKNHLQRKHWMILDIEGPRRDHKCQICESSFITNSELNAHSRNKHTKILTNPVQNVTIDTSSDVAGQSTDHGLKYDPFGDNDSGDPGKNVGNAPALTSPSSLEMADCSEEMHRMLEAIDRQIAESLPIIRTIMEHSNQKMDTTFKQHFLTTVTERIARRYDEFEMASKCDSDENDRIDQCQILFEVKKEPDEEVQFDDEIFDQQIDVAENSAEVDCAIFASDDNPNVEDSAVDVGAGDVEGTSGMTTVAKENSTMTSPRGTKRNKLHECQD